MALANASSSHVVQLRGTFKVGLGQIAAVRYPMFFATEPKIEWDEYGEVGYRSNPTVEQLYAEARDLFCARLSILKSSRMPHYWPTDKRDATGSQPKPMCKWRTQMKIRRWRPGRPSL